jgi:hypothetical protein
MKNIIFLSLIISFLSCRKDVTNPIEDSGHSAITTMTLKFKENGGVTKEFTFDDPDGPGGKSPIKFDTIVLSLGKSYSVEIVLLDKTKNPPVDVTPTIINAGHQHQFFFIGTNLSNLSITPTDKDRIGYPIGIQSNWVTPSTGNQTGTMKVMLRHIVFGKSNNTSPTAGHSDIQVDFPLQINL